MRRPWARLRIARAMPRHCHLRKESDPHTTQPDGAPSQRVVDSDRSFLYVLTWLSLQTRRECLGSNLPRFKGGRSRERVRRHSSVGTAYSS